MDVLDARLAGVAPSRARVVHGAVALALTGPSVGELLERWSLPSRT